MQRRGEPGSVSLDHGRLNHLEEVILAKVQQRTPQRMNEDTFIVKTFRYYDLSNSGFCDLGTFGRALGPFTSGISEKDLASVFGRYSPSGPLNYKVFAAEFVDGVRRQPDLIGDAGQDDEETPQDVLLRMKHAIYSQGPRAIVGLAAALHEADPQNSRSIPYSAFQMVISDFFGAEPASVREEQIDQVFDLLRLPYAPDHMAYDELLVALQDELSPARRDAVRAAFRRLDTTSEGLVDMAHVVRSFNAGRHPQVSDGTRQPDEVRGEFADTLRDAVAFRRGQRLQANSPVAWEEFEDYWKLVSGCCGDDGLFCALLQRSFDLDKAPNQSIEGRAGLARPAAGIPGKSRAGLHHWQSNTLPTNPTHHNVRACASLENVLSRLRGQVASRGLRAAVGVVENFYSADDDVDDALDAYEFRRACQQSGFVLRDVEETEVFEACGAEAGGGRLSLPHFLRMLHGPLSERRHAAVERAFHALGGDPSDAASAVSPGMLKERFACDAHPLVAKGELEAAAAAAEFLDTFSLLAHVRGGCRDGMVAFSDFLAYYEVVSSIIDNDAFFELLLNRVWSLPSPSEEGGPPFGNASSRRRSAGSSSPMREPRPPAHSGPSAYQRPGGEDSPARPDTHRRFMRKEAGAGDQAVPPAPGFSAITKSSIVFDEAETGELGAALRHLREGLARRGIRGWHALAQRFQQQDTRKNGTVMRLDWERLHRTLGLGLQPEDRQLLFQSFSAGRRDGAMDYRELLRRLCGPVPERRRALVERLFEALREGPEVSAEALKARYDPRNAPPCLLGKATPAQVAQDFGEAVDFFAGDRGFDAARFAELFGILSALHPEEDEFRLATTAAFGVLPGGVGQGGA